MDCGAEFSRFTRDVDWGRVGPTVISGFFGCFCCLVFIGAFGLFGADLGGVRQYRANMKELRGFWSHELEGATASRCILTPKTGTAPRVKPKTIRTGDTSTPHSHNSFPVVNLAAQEVFCPADVAYDSTGMVAGGTVPAEVFAGYHFGESTPQSICSSIYSAAWPNLRIYDTVEHSQGANPGVSDNMNEGGLTVDLSPTMWTCGDAGVLNCSRPIEGHNCKYRFLGGSGNPPTMVVEGAEYTRYESMTSGINFNCTAQLAAIDSKGDCLIATSGQVMLGTAQSVTNSLEFTKPSQGVSTAMHVIGVITGLIGLCCCGITFGVCFQACHCMDCLRRANSDYEPL